MNDHYLDLVHFHWDTIYRAYSDFADKKPVILLHLKEAKVYAYPFPDFKATLYIAVSFVSIAEVT